MNWSSTLNFQECVDFVGKWYSNFYYGTIDNFEFTSKQMSNMLKSQNLEILAGHKNEPRY